MTLLFAPVTVQAQALSCALPDRIPVPRLEQPRRDEPVRKPPITGYLLALSWSPQHCAGARNPKDARDRFQCSGENGRFGWVLHGLWPETDTPAYPQWCRPAKIVPAPVLRRHMCMTPSAQLLQHEWAKHGTCMSSNPAAYFRAAEILFRAVRFPDMKALAAQLGIAIPSFWFALLLVYVFAVWLRLVPAGGRALEHDGLVPPRPQQPGERQADHPAADDHGPHHRPERSPRPAAGPASAVVSATWTSP